MVVSDDALPPVVTCAQCRRAECPGCAPTPSNNPERSLAWEAKGLWTRRLWRTSFSGCTNPEKTFGELPDGALSSAFAFAFIAESIAIVTLAVFALAVAFAIAPTFVSVVVSDSAARILGAEVLIGTVVMLVGMHAVWGLCLEAGAAMSGSRAHWRLGVRFGLYACGWDLVTSPAGVTQCLLSQGVASGFDTVFAAARVARRAMRAYMIQNREFDSRAERRGTLVALSVLGIAMFTLAIGLLTLVVRVALAQ